MAIQEVILQLKQENLPVAFRPSPRDAIPGAEGMDIGSWHMAYKT